MDRNYVDEDVSVGDVLVVLLAEDVDRNTMGATLEDGFIAVVLLAEDVDRNAYLPSIAAVTTCRPPRGGRG